MIRIAKAASLAAAGCALVLGGAGAAAASDGAHAQGATIGSGGIASGNVVQVPVHAPVNVCGNTVSVIGLLNPSFGNTCLNA
ncbi:chaplin [Streptomyces sp. TRM 70361]|uniref:chaplin n=1 Tax=Streptomyces sp. TRM 70361 TaxID=3116553 RepID=UPI002E7AF302|nr:chaplin [Streptomyces sp. TRM 70361]MEE1942949.1 chaplin [Streptomyces sp. TRM 70361]